MRVGRETSALRGAGALKVTKNPLLLIIRRQRKPQGERGLPRTEPKPLLSTFPQKAKEAAPSDTMFASYHFPQSPHANGLVSQPVWPLTKMA